MFAPQAHHLTKQHYLYSLMPLFWSWNLAPVEWDVSKAKKKVHFSRLALQICHPSTEPPFHTRLAFFRKATLTTHQCCRDLLRRFLSEQWRCKIIPWWHFKDHLVSPYLLGDWKRSAKSIIGLCESFARKDLVSSCMHVNREVCVNIYTYIYICYPPPRGPTFQEVHA